MGTISSGSTVPAVSSSSLPKTPRLEKPLLYQKIHNGSTLSGCGDAS
jgi:hypothetical protein